MKARSVLLLLCLPLLLAACGGGSAAPEPVATIAVSTAVASPTEAVATPLPPTETMVVPPTAIPTSSPLPPTSTAAAPTETPPPPTALPATATVTPEPEGEGQSAPSNEEEIAILVPGPGSRVTSPLRVSGEADSTFEQSLVLRLVSADGTELALLPTNIQGELGQRGTFEAQIPFEVTGQTQGFLQIFSQSPADGAIEHLAAVGVTLAESGAEEIRPAASTDERIIISQPANGATISGGVVRVEGIALASFEQTLVVDLLDFDGNTLVRKPITVQAPDLGQPGPFSVELPYSVSSSMPARISVRDPSPAFNGTLHLNSIIVTLAP